MEQMENEMSRNVFQEVIGFDAGRNRRDGAEVVDCSIIWFT